MAIAKRSLLEVLQRSVGDLPPFATLLDQPDAQSEMLSDDEFVVGTPAQVAAQLAEQCQILGAGHVLAIFAATEKAELAEAHELFSREVIPVLRATVIEGEGH